MWPFREKIQNSGVPSVDGSNILIAISDAKAEFDDAVRLAKLENSDLPTQLRSLIEEIGNEFADLSNKVSEKPQPQIDFKRRAEALSRFRAYVLPDAQARSEAAIVEGELRSWKIPGEVLSDTQAFVKQVIAGTSKSRPQLERVLSEYDYWASYVEFWKDWTKKVSWMLIATIVVALILAYISLAYGQSVLGFLLAGVAGTGVSILLKLPTMSVYGEYAVSTSRVLSRFAAGLTGALIGCGFLSFGIFDINGKGGQSLSAVLNGQGTPIVSASQPSENSTPATVSASSEGKVATDLPAPSNPSQGVIAILMAVAILLGFSERTLGSFEEIVVPVPKRGKPDSMPTALRESQ